MFSLLLKELIFYFYFHSLQCGGRKTSPRTSAIVLFIFYFWSFEVSVNVLRNQKLRTGLDSYSRQVFNHSDPILIYISLWIDCLFENRKIASCFSSFRCRSLQGHWWGSISRNFVVWPIFFLMNVFIDLKGTHIWFLFAFTAAGVVQCGGRKHVPRTSIIMQFIFYFWSFEISVNIKRNPKVMIGLDSYCRQVLIIWTPFWFRMMNKNANIIILFCHCFRGNALSI